MSDIRYVCLSDMHFGADDSLLTNLNPGAGKINTSSASPVVAKLVECLRVLIDENQNKEDKPTLILNGDILEMALCTTNDAAMVFERFFELIMPKGEELFDRIIYIPGNHDHHLWETARETQYINHVERHVGWGEPLDKPWHTTNMFIDDAKNPIPSYFLTKLTERYYRPQERKVGIHVAYPNFGLLSKDNKKSVIFSHGHYIEPLYHLMSKLKEMLFPRQKKAKQIWHIETENFAWIDFFWSSMGRSGEVGDDVEWIYEKMGSEKGVKELIRRLAEGLAKEVDLPFVPERWEDDAIAKVLTFALNQFSSTERKKPIELSEEAEEGLKEYMQVPLKNQILDEIKGVPDDVTFVLGHTHKPFEDKRTFEGYKNEVNVYNSGGWVVESAEVQKLHGGSIVLVDEKCNAAAIRMYNETDGKYKVSVNVAGGSAGSKNELYNSLNSKIDATKDPWSEFSGVTSDEVKKRKEFLKRKTRKGA